MYRKVFKKGIVMVLILTMLMLTLSGCNKGAEPAPEQSPSEEVAVEKPLEKIKLSLSTHDPAQSGNTNYQQQWAEKVKEATNGQVEITIYPGSALSAPTDVLDAIKTGVCDIGWVYTTFYQGQFPLTDVVGQPMLGINTASQATKVLWNLYESTEEFKKETEEFKMLMMFTNNSNIIATTKKPVLKKSDLTGMKLRSTAGTATDMVTAWGGTPTLMGPGDMYQAMEKGVIQGCVFEYSGIGSFKLNETLKHYTEVPIFVGPFYLLMNKAKWDSLPDNVKDAINSLTDLDVSVEAAKVFEADAERVRAQIVKDGGNMITLSDEAYKEFKKAADEYNNVWAQKHKTANFDAEEYLKRTIELVEKLK